ncbi:uncharacterized protein LOC135111963 [Scylla paramamosain]|uniref:uncharacterized protein LOC135111963 n=1 Tax=Scylla paramamosain TaxID=85552 RepID=UPI003083C99F
MRPSPCITRLHHHQLTGLWNVGTSSETVSWYPRVLEVVEGDSVTWQWSKVSENSCSCSARRWVRWPAPVDNCEDADGSGLLLRDTDCCRPSGMAVRSWVTVGSHLPGCRESGRQHGSGCDPILEMPLGRRSVLVKHPVGVTSASDTSVTCDLDDLDNLRSGAYLPITVKAINRGIAVTDIAGYSSEGRVVVVPQVSSLSPLEGSLGGSTLLTISGSSLQGLVASPVVLVGGQTCVVQSVSSTTVTCLTPPSTSATVATFTLTVAGVPAKMDTLTFTYSEALTPVVTSMAVQGEEVTLSGHNFGSDNTKVTITLVQQSVPHGCREVPQEEEKEDLMVEEREEWWWWC